MLLGFFLGFPLFIAMLTVSPLLLVYVKPDIPGFNKTTPMTASLNGTKLGTGCSPFTKDLTGKVVVVLRGDCLFSIKAQNALDKGAIGILFVNNVEGSLAAAVAPVPIPSSSLSLEEGAVLLSELMKAQSKTGTTTTTTADWTTDVEVAFSDAPKSFIDPAGASTSLFSSYGLDNQLHIKPVSDSISWL